METLSGQPASYSSVLERLYQLEDRGIRLGLERVQKLCDILGNPERSYKVVHIAGTNGKGSVSAMCSSILREAGYGVGLYTSPHLQSFRERIQCNGSLVSPEEVVRLYREVSAACARMGEEKDEVTFFEFVTAMAFLYFREKGCDVAVLEVGLGGRLDATNIVSPEVAVITRIAEEHTEYLGGDTASIAREKAGIIKQGSVVISSEPEESIARVFSEICRERGARFVDARREYAVRILENSVGKLRLRIRGKNGSCEVSLSLPGEHQAWNAVAAVAAVEALAGRGVPVSKEQIVQGLGRAAWPGRMECMQANPTVLLDGAHNPDGARAAAQFVKALGKTCVLVLGVSEGKNLEGMASELVPLAKKVFVARARYRGAPVENVLEKVKRHCSSAAVIEDVKEAVRAAMQEAGEEGLVLVTGSLFVVGEARGLWHPVAP